MSTVSLLPTLVNFEIPQNTDNLIEFTLTDAGGTAADLSADTVTLVIKTNYGGVVKVSKSNGPLAHSSPTTGQTRFVLTKSELTGSNLAVQEAWVYQVRRIFGGTLDEVVYISGSLILQPSF